MLLSKEEDQHKGYGGERTRTRRLMAEPRHQQEAASRVWAAAAIGAVVGFNSAVLAFDAADRYGPSTVHPATVDWIGRVPASRPGFPDRYGFAAETDCGQLIRSIDRDLYYDLRQGQRIEVTISDFTGTPVAVDTANQHYDLLAHHAAIEAIGIVLIAAMALLAIVTLRSTNRAKILIWGMIGILAGFLAPVLWTLPVLAARLTAWG
jgi:hypothetical protein